MLSPIQVLRPNYRITIDKPVRQTEMKLAPSILSAAIGTAPRPLSLLQLPEEAEGHPACEDHSRGQDTPEENLLQRRRGRLRLQLLHSAKVINFPSLVIF